MCTDDVAALARRYVELSNEHRLEAVFELFHEDAVYESSGVGRHQGRPAIEQMMRQFFEAFPDVRWEVAEYRVTGVRTVEFDFTRLWTEGDDGSTRRRHGWEQIVFDEAGRIARVKTRATEATD